MDSAVLLDLLGNENRRRILRLLSHKPCYVTEISEYLGVSPKAVIDHLRRLEEAGLVESRTDDKRRKYFHIARNLRLEVSVSPYRFGAKSAYPASRSLDIRGRCQHLKIELPELDDDRREEPDGDDGADPARRDQDTESHPTPIDSERERRKPGDLRTEADPLEDPDSEVAELAREYAYLDDIESELSLAQRWVHGRVTDVLDALSDRLGSEADSRFYAEMLAAISREARSVGEIAREVNADPDRVARALERLEEQGLVVRDGAEWRIA
ncbi:ArsR family transcriptional regulator [Halobellus sp. EA9]|uniref:ArsR/SmtB family transcription factor n=1 Tax=Halobellus sp. EA9 TaxID=3421647 RepID=UPI003EB88426